MCSSADSPTNECSDHAVLCCGQLLAGELKRLAGRYGVQVENVADDESIQGSYWGDREAGLIGTRLLVRGDTPVHSALHELCHFVCMEPAARAQLDTNAGGDYDEENAVCYLQIVLADELPDCSRARMQADMDAWGYTFRLGSARRWFEDDAEDARIWLQKYGLIDARERPTWAVRSLSR